MLVQKCVLRRETLPILPCDCSECEWYVDDPSYNNCFWALAHLLDSQPGIRFSFEEIAKMEGITLEEVMKAYESAINKLRKDSRKIMKNDTFDNIS